MLQLRFRRLFISFESLGPVSVNREGTLRNVAPRGWLETVQSEVSFVGATDTDSR
jgi:hypothetical protein